MLKIYYFLVGYVSVVLVGKNCENLLNAAARNRISFSSLHYRKGRIEGNITVSDFRRLRECVRGTGARVHIVGKHGIPFITARYRNRIGFFIGMIIFSAIIYTLSLFVWNIEVTGNRDVSLQTIISACEELDITVGALKKSIDPKVDSQRLMLCADGIAWASITIEGCELTVNISEIKNEQTPKEEPCNLIASADGIINKIDLTEGNALVSVGDVVKKGDILVSGIFERLSGTEFVVSSGIVEANTTREFSASADYIQYHYIPTGKVRSHTVLSLFWLDIPLYVGEIKGDHTAEVTSKKLELFGNTLPVALTTKKFTETKKMKFEYSRDELEEQLKKDVEKQIKNMGISDYSVKTEAFSENDDGISVFVTVSANENIAEKEKILIGS